ncbi:MAG: hypothetical protein K2Q09_10415, partial [Phycisphaerales bacterium]|nr:hypothetical protein [Phycisphaerales bacterium]
MAATPVRTADSGSGDQGRITRPTGRETVLVLDFGGQTAQLIARRVREAGVFSLLIRPDAPLEEIRAHNPSGIILSGGPKSVYEPGAPTCDPGVLTLGVPVLGICYGMQLVGQFLGMKVSQGGHREFGRAEIEVRAGRDGGRD